MATSSDPASLQHLNPIVSPEPVSLWPLAPGWYVLIGIAALLVCWAAWLGWRRWQANAYRRAALKEFSRISPEHMTGLPGLLKRAALAAYPRQQVAALSGVQWHDFLTRSNPKSGFDPICGAALDQLSYDGDSGLSALQSQALLQASSDWLQHHRLEALQ